MNAFLVALLVGFFCGVVNLLVDIPALWNYDWSHGLPSYFDLVRSRHRHLHTPLFCLLVTIPLWSILITLIPRLHLGQYVVGGMKMYLILLCNLIFYLSPYIAMILYDLSSRTPKKNRATLSLVLTIGLVSSALFSIAEFLILGYCEGGKYTILFGYIPTYLALFYTVSTAICVLILYLEGHSHYHSLLFGFLISYVNSFYWEIPENIFWQLKRGYHPAIIFVLLGVFPYIWLNKKLEWKKNMQNISLVLLGWAVTTFGVLTMKSNIYIDPTEALYYLFCRCFCLVVLIKIFLTGRQLGGLKQLTKNFERIRSFSFTEFIIYLKWCTKYLLVGNWRLGTEIAYWDYQINHIRPEGWCLPVIHRDLYGALKRIEKRFSVSGRDIKVLELGPGPRSRLTEVYDKGMIDLVAVDPLANEFKKHLGGRDFLLQGFGENIESYFPAETFHLSYASNVLDHSQNIHRCFQNMLNLTKISGMMIIQGNIKEGERLNWVGLHKYSTWIEKGDIIYCERDGKEINLTEDRGIDFIVRRERIIEGNLWYSVMYRRVS